MNLPPEKNEQTIDIYRLGDDERYAVRRGIREMRDERFASDERIAAIFNSHRSPDAR